MARVGSVPRTIALILVAAVLLPSSRAIAADYCNQLKAQLTSLTQNGKRPNEHLRRQLWNAQHQARRVGCRGGMFFFRSRSSPQCPALIRKISQLQRELSRSAFALGNSRQIEARRASLRRALANGRCTNTGTSQQAGSYRTLCVRSCDGYYFPISFATTRQRFKKDQAVCQSNYPPGQAELYVHRNPGEDVERMVSLAGDPYAKKPFAFAHRQEFMPVCVALLRKNGTNVASLGGKSVVNVPIPALRPASEDPETLANIAGGLVIEQRLGTAIEVADVRTLGSNYYYREQPLIEFSRRKWAPALSPPVPGPVSMAEAAKPTQRAAAQP